MSDEFVVPHLVKVYHADFGKTEQSIIEFIYRYLDNPEIEMNQAIKEVRDKRMWI